MAKPNIIWKLTLAAIAFLLLLTGTVFGAIWVSHADTRRVEANQKCTTPGAVHKAVFQDDKVLPERTDARRCDKLIITNLDDKPRILAFGEHDSHQAYDGVTERFLDKDYKVEITLIKRGTYRFHDHITDIGGTFTVK